MLKPATVIKYKFVTFKKFSLFQRFQCFILPGEYEPTDPECEWPSDEEDEDEELAEEVKDKVIFK
jgi:hypothetical protein